MNTRSLKGISPVIATIVVIAVAVAISLAVAFWASGLVGTFTRFEKLEIKNSYVTREVNEYRIVVSYKNSGSSDVTLTEIFVSDKPLSQFWSTATVNETSFTQVFIPAGTDGVFSISFPDDAGVKAFVEGQTIEIKAQSSSGVYYVGTFIIP
ncbi:MAG: archaellin/type IV pilin N-terminal domain-containing protein [Nitrososphaeria archaeon]